MTKHFLRQMARRDFLAVTAGAAAATLLPCDLAAAEDLPPDVFTVVKRNVATGSSLAVVVGDVPLVHTEQVFARFSPSDFGPGGKDPLFGPLEEILKRAGSSLSQVVRFNFYATDAKLTGDLFRLAQINTGKHRPVVTSMVGALPNEGYNMAVDAIAIRQQPIEPGKVLRVEGAAVLPPMHKLYVSGDAANGPLNDAVRGTLESLERTLKYCGLDWSHAVHLKSFLQPIGAAADVRREMQDYFGSRPVPALSFVEWKSSEKTPIEIELIAAVPPDLGNKPDLAVEYLTPPGMDASPVFSRAVRVRSPKTIYTSSFYGNSSDPVEQVQDIFGELQKAVEPAGSDLRHLVKATYYVTDAPVSKALGELRPKYYDAARPPAASKATVSGTGQENRTLTLDMIAVPRQS